MSSMAVSATSRRGGVEKCRPKTAKIAETASRNRPFLPQNVLSVIVADDMSSRLGHHRSLRRHVGRHVVRHGDRDDMSADMSSATVTETTYRPMAIRRPQRRPRRHVTDKNDETMTTEARQHRDDMSKNDDMSSRREMSSFVDACLTNTHPPTPTTTLYALLQT